MSEFKFTNYPGFTRVEHISGETLDSNRVLDTWIEKQKLRLRLILKLQAEYGWE